jgi:hypothetical protein
MLAALLYTFTMQANTIKQNLKRYLSFGALFIAGPIFFMTTNPESLPLPLLVLPFIWLFAVLFTVAWLLLGTKESIQRKKAVLIAGSVATIPVLLAVFQSIHQLSVRDVLLSVGLVMLAAVYMLRADFIK